MENAENDTENPSRVFCIASPKQYSSRFLSSLSPFLFLFSFLFQ